jgi:ComF family protein
VLKSILGHVSQFFYPSFCHICSEIIEVDYLVCGACSNDFAPLASYSMPLTKKYDLTICALSLYQEPFRSLLLQKNQNNGYCFKGLAKLVAYAMGLSSGSASFFVPIPLHWTRKLWRGYNQSEVLAESYSEVTGIPVLNCLARERKTVFQSALNKKERHDNVKNAFVVQRRYEKMLKHLLKDKNIVIVDDLVTTGATLREAGKILAQFQPASITALVVCRAL